ncbi:zinc finger protein 704-like [Nothobranchius furzeri]|uniref:zinc finger protein 704-like n=1 Tax=Nothobranchius furzeri TaxID=105023 RepID=UPI0039049F32
MSPAAASPTSAPKPSSVAPLPAVDTPSGPCLSPGLPPTSPSPAQSPSTPSPHPVKPPRSSIAGLTIDLLGGREVEEEEEEGRREKEAEPEEAFKEGWSEGGDGGSRGGRGERGRNSESLGVDQRLLGCSSAGCRAQNKGGGQAK